MNKFVERINSLMSYLKLNDWKFCNELKINYRFFESFLRYMRDLQMDEVQKILKRWPEINARWLILGEGEMINFDIKKDENTETSTTK
jgi:hypothetical protein